MLVCNHGVCDHCVAGSGRRAGSTGTAAPVVGNVILHDKLKFWTDPRGSVHYHQGNRQTHRSDLIPDHLPNQSTDLKQELLKITRGKHRFSLSHAVTRSPAAEYTALFLSVKCVIYCMHVRYSY